jgi:hypothetical protein
MGKWKQVSGDMSFDSVGCTIAKVSPKYRQVELVKITPWLELDSSALKEGYGFWDVEETTIDYDDLSVKRDDVLSAIQSAGMSIEEYKKLDPAGKAVVITDHSGFDSDSRSTNDFADALPVGINEIEWWHKGDYDIESINSEMRYAVTNKVYGGDFRDEVPDDEALELAMGDEEATAELTDDEAQALRYALAVSSGKYTWPKSSNPDKNIKIPNIEAMKKLLDALFNAPESASLEADKLAKLFGAYNESFDLDWEDKREQANYMIDEDAKAAHELGNSIIQRLGL